MHVVPSNVPFNDLHVQARANHSDQFPYAGSYLLAQYWLAVLGYPYEVILQVIHAVRCFAIRLAHRTASPLKSSSKDEGVSPRRRLYVLGSTQMSWRLPW